MRLLDTWTGQFVEKDPRDPKTKYAILSHTWDGKGEQTYQDLKRIQKRNAVHARPAKTFRHCDSPRDPPPFPPSDITSSIRYTHNVTILTSDLSLAQDGTSSISLGTPTSSSLLSFLEPQDEPDSFSTAIAVPGLSPLQGPDVIVLTSPLGAPSELTPLWNDPALSPKIREACKVAREKGYLYIWIDSCCIDKMSSSELSEAINSMYYWYSRAEVCYAFLADVPAQEDPGQKHSLFRQSRWFTRGWTLQELIAPVHVTFLSSEWSVIGSKSTLSHVVTDITNIDRHALLRVKGLEEFSVAQRFSWAAGRQTTRMEDRAYSLLGLFDLNMPIIYGEGDRAFRRLQEEILRRIPDQSLFAWTSFPFDSSGSAGMTHFVKLNHTAKKKKYVYSNCSQWDTSSSLLASSPDAFGHCGGITVVDHDQVLYRLQPRPYTLGFDVVKANIPIVPHIVATHNYVFSPHGVQTQVFMTPFSCYLLPSDITPRSSHSESQENNLKPSTCYLVVLGCEHKGFPGRLLARPCFVSGSAVVPLLRCGSVSIHSKRPSGPRLIADLLPISRENIQHLYQSSGHTALIVRSVYLDYPGGADEEFELEVARRQPHESITLILSPGALSALDARGYRVRMRGPDQAHPGYHAFAFSNDAHTITVKCHCTLEGDAENQKLAIEGYIKLSGTLLDDTSREVHQVDGPTTLSWTGSIPWSSSLGVETVVLHVAQARIMSLQLGLNFVAKDHYCLDVAISAHSTATCCSHLSQHPPRGVSKGVWKKLNGAMMKLPILVGIATRMRTMLNAGGAPGEG